MKRALVADDHAENLYFLGILLKANGFDVVDTAENGAQALELARAHLPDLIISDILMPVMDGYALCRALKADPHLNGIPLIFYTATFTSAKDEELALSLGADRFVVKPQEPDALMLIVNQVMSTPRREVAQQSSAGEQQVMKEYSEALFRKLEKKMEELEQANRELRQRERELLAAREAAQCANQAKLRFLSIMSHELRTPLNAILCALQLLELEKVYDAEMTDAAKAAVSSMTDIIDNILEVSRIESAAFSFVQGPLPLDLLVHTLRRLFAFAAESKGLRLQFSCADDLPQQIITDGAHLRQILVHLINNAIKFTEHGGVEVRLSQEAGGMPDKPVLKIEVHDTGIGIDPDKQQLVFGLFTQADDSDTRLYGGIGLGLALTKRVVELMGGTISVQSSAGFGSVFTVRLPLLVTQ